MEKARRDHLRSVIGEVRGEIEQSLISALAVYGLRVDSDAIPLDELPLDEVQRALYPRLTHAVSREARAVGASSPLAREAVRRYVREAGGTWINRLAALRALEVRGLLEPRAAFISVEYADTSPRALRLQTLDPSLGSAEALRRGIIEACTELSADVRVLFDTDDDKTLVWPSHAALRKVLRAFSDAVNDDDWRQDDVLGWVYQYYNTAANAELKARKKKTQSYKYTADDIPIANQFYTPHWVVRVLTDNTLGRLWLESKNRDPRMNAAEASDDGATHTRWSLVERRDGVPDASKDADGFRAWVATEPDPVRDHTVDQMCRYLVPLPSVPPNRRPKHPRDIKVIDPACGSGHFLLYAFDVLLAMWREAEPSLDPLEIPAKILENNLHGLDIDLRAAQLAAFNLYLKARTTHRALAKTVGRPSAPFALRRVNIVVADAHLGNDPRKTAFLDRYKTQPDVQALYAEVLRSVDHTNVLGGLLKVRSTFEGLFHKVSDAHMAEKTSTRKALAPKQGAFAFGSGAQRELAETFLAGSGRHWTLGELLDELRAFEREALGEQDVGARLFYHDLGHTLGLLGLLSQQYDVVLMNPPYGDMPEAAKDYCKGNQKKKIRAQYPRTHQDYATAFLEQALDVLHESGFVGMLVPRSFMHLGSFADVRSEILLHESHPEVVIDLGRGILDRADVRVAAAIVRARRKDNSQTKVVFQRLSYYRDAERHGRWTETFPSFVGRGPRAEIDWYIASLASLRSVPGMPYAYWASDSMRAMFVRLPAINADLRTQRKNAKHGLPVAGAYVGIQTSDDPRFLRFFWEVREDSIGKEKRWVPLLKGGPGVAFYSRADSVMNWENDGQEQLAFGEGRYQGISHFFSAATCWSMTSWRLRRFGLIDDSYAFGVKACLLKIPNCSPESVTGIMQSSLANALMYAMKPERDWTNGDVARLPWTSVPNEIQLRLGTLALEGVALFKSRHVGDETCRDFSQPDLMRLHIGGGDSPDKSFRLDTLLSLWFAERQRTEANIARLLQEIDDSVYGLYGISDDDRNLVKLELARRPKAEGGYSSDAVPEEDSLDGDTADDDDSNDDDEEDLDDTPTAMTPGLSRDLVSRWLSHYVKRCIEADDDGIVPVSSSNREDALILRVRAAMKADLGQEAAGQLEAQAATYLGTTSIAEWIEVSGEDTVTDAAGKKSKEPRGFMPWHVRLYRSRPIFWMLSSENFEKAKTRFTFRVYLHALKVSGDTLTRVQTYYLQPELDRVKNETALAFRRKEQASGAARNAAEREHQEWVNTEAALKAFLGALEEAAKGPPKREVVAASAKWPPRTIAEVRGGQDVGHGWRPEVDHGVRVNIAPLVEKRLLPRAVLKKLGGK